MDKYIEYGNITSSIDSYEEKQPYYINKMEISASSLEPHEM